MIRRYSVSPIKPRSLPLAGFRVLFSKAVGRVDKIGLSPQAPRVRNEEHRVIDFLCAK